MFAYAIWDSDRRRLFAVRDRMGIKPFYYYWDGRFFAFASEIKALLAHPDIHAELEERVVPEYLAFGFISEERTLFRGIRKLLPGHHLTVDLGGAKPAFNVRRYWDVPLPVPSSASEKDLTAETRLRLEESVRLRLMSDVPLGMFLSGGVDSSAIAALTKKLTDGPVKTFAVGYEGQFSELGYAAQVAQAIGTDHYEVKVGLDDFFNELPRLIWHEDEPISWPSSVSLYFVSRLAAEQVKVVLTGEGSDEIFGGYERYRWHLFNARASEIYGTVPRFLRETISGHLQSTPLLTAPMRRKMRHTFVGREGTPQSLLLDNFYCAFSADEQRQLLRAKPRDIYANYLRYWAARDGNSLLCRMLYADQKTYLVELLMKQDQMSMAASIESRVPFLDHALVEFAARIPSEFSIKGLSGKHILKEAVEDLLPESIVFRKKMGFPTPWAYWLAGPQLAHLERMLLDSRTVQRGFFKAEAVKRLFAEHRAQHRDHGNRIWRLLNLEIWQRIFVDGETPTGEREAATDTQPTAISSCCIAILPNQGSEFVCQ